MSVPFRVPLEPRETPGAFDVGLAACGGSPTVFLRLALAGAAPAAVLADAAGRAFDLGLPTAAAAALFVTAPLGLRVATAAAAGTFADGPRRPVRTRRRRTLEAALAAALVLLAALYFLPRLISPPTAAGAFVADRPTNFWVGVLFAAGLGGRAALDLSDRFPLPPRSRRLVAGRLIRRAVLGWPVGLFFLPDATGWAWAALILWGPFGVALSGRAAYRCERAALRAVSVKLHDDHADALLKSVRGDLGMKAVLFALLCGGLWVAAGLTFDLACSALLGWRPVLGGVIAAGSPVGLAADPTAAAVSAAAAVGAYVVGRVGWFAVLVDLRVRRDCWDVQRVVRRERDRLAAAEAAAAGRVLPRAAAVLLFFLPWTGAAAAQSDPGATDPAEVVARAGAILDRDEFRHLRDFGAAGDDLFPPLSGPAGAGGAGDESAPGSAPGDADEASGGGADGAGGASGGGSGAGGAVVGAVGLLGAAVGTLAVWMAGLLLAALAVGLVFVLVKSWLDRERAGKTQATAAAAVFGPDELTVPPGEVPPDAFLEAARSHAAAGRYAAAVGVLQSGLAGEVERAGLIRPRRGLTAREYLRAARPDARLRPALDEVVPLYEPLGYGRREAREEHFVQAERAYLDALAAERGGGRTE